MTKPTHLKIVDHPNLVRESSSKAILNVDQQALIAAKKKKRDSKLLENLLSRVEMLEARMAAIEKGNNYGK